MARMRETKAAYRVLVGKPRRRLEDNIKIDQVIGCGLWIGTGGELFEDGNEPSGAVKCGEFFLTS